MDHPKLCLVNQHISISSFQLLSLVYKVLSVIAMEPKTQIAGVTVIVDCAGFGYHQFKNLSFDDVRIVSMFAQVSKFHS